MMKKSFLFILMCFLLFTSGCTSTKDSKSLADNNALQYQTRFSVYTIPHLDRSIDFDAKRMLSESAKQLATIPCIGIVDNSSVPASMRLIDYPRFMDETGFFTTIKSRPKKTAVLFSSYAQVWELAGGTVSISVQETIDRSILSGMTPLIVGQASGKDINLELLLSYHPDLVILTADYASHLELAETLRSYDIPVLVFRVDSFLDYLKMLQVFTRILNTQTSYVQNGSNVLDRIDSILEVTNEIETSPNVLFLRAYSYGAKVKGDNHFVGQMLNDLGAHNIASTNDSSLDTLSPEVLLTSKIDLILISVMGEDYEAAKSYVTQELFTLPAYQSLDAVKNHHYYFLPKELFSFKPNNDWDKAYQYLANLLYPEQFSFSVSE